MWYGCPSPWYMENGIRNRLSMTLRVMKCNTNWYSINTIILYLSRTSVEILWLNQLWMYCLLFRRLVFNSKDQTMTMPLRKAKSLKQRRDGWCLTSLPGKEKDKSQYLWRMKAWSNNRISPPSSATDAVIFTSTTTQPLQQWSVNLMVFGPLSQHTSQAYRRQNCCITVPITTSATAN